MTRTIRHRFRPIVAAALCLLCSHGWGSEPRSLEELLVDASQMLTAQAREAYPDGRIEAHMQSLDPRLNLPPCEDAELAPRSQQRYGRIPVAVQCRTPQPWSIFLTGDVSVAVPVVVTTRPIRRGEIIRDSMIHVTEQELTGLHGLFYSDPAGVIGRESRRNLQEAQVVLATQLAEPLAVERGAKVEIIARHGPVQIRSLGEALGDARVGAEVRVRNLDSGRIIRGWVEAPGSVVTSPGGRAEAGSRRPGG